MVLRKALYLVLAGLLLVAGCLAQSAPKVALSANRMPTSGHVYVRGSGFTPKHNVSSHLRKPDGSEYPVLPILTDERGEFTHDIEGLVLSVGTHELWVVDDGSKVTSNKVQFEVSNDESPRRP